MTYNPHAAAVLALLWLAFVLPLLAAFRSYGTIACLLSSVCMPLEPETGCHL